MAGFISRIQAREGMVIDHACVCVSCFSTKRKSWWRTVYR